MNQAKYPMRLREWLSWASRLRSIAPAFKVQLTEDIVMMPQEIKSIRKL